MTEICFISYLLALCSTEMCKREECLWFGHFNHSIVKTDISFELIPQFCQANSRQIILHQSLNSVFMVKYWKCPKKGRSLCFKIHKKIKETIVWINKFLFKITEFSDLREEYLFWDENRKIMRTMNVLVTKISLSNDRVN